MGAPRAEGGSSGPGREHQAAPVVRGTRGGDRERRSHARRHRRDTNDARPRRRTARMNNANALIATALLAAIVSIVISLATIEARFRYFDQRLDNIEMAR